MFSVECLVFSENIGKKLKKLKKILTEKRNLLIAYSGGCDSSFLVKVASDILGKRNVMAVTATSATYTKAELDNSKKFTRRFGIRHIMIKTEEVSNPSFSKNPVNRCYWCKKELFSKLKDIAKKYNINHIADGTNLDDARDYRPGSLAKTQYGIISPLKEARLTKQQIRQISKKIGLPTWNKPALACLASRIPYADPITEKKLRKIEDAENFLKKQGFKQVRVRLHGDIARIEVPRCEINKLNKSSLRDKIIKNFKKLGFIYITLDLEGYRTGSLNEVLKQ